MSGIDCEPCGRHFRLHAHYEDHRIHSAQHHYCAPCGRDFVSEHAKQNHLLHSQRHQLCKWCQTPLGKLRTHNQNHHEQCTECGEWCENAATLLQHYTFDHFDVYCAPCKRLFRRPNELHMHLRSSVHQPRDVKCPHRDCGRGFVSKAALVQHFEANTCPSGVNLDQVDSFFGHDCDPHQRFVKRNLIIPALRSCDVSPGYDGIYECGYCHKSFRHEGQFLFHINGPKHKNHGNKPYQCPSNLCGQAEFYSLGNLMFHLETGDCERYHERALSGLVDELSKMVERLGLASYCDYDSDSDW